jgi:two-component system, OmpR family, alkaline phosphatase synthesis response regulator PhoP
MAEKEQHILLVDDEEDILEFLSYNLKREGYTVRTAGNGRDAILIAAEIKPALIILDVMMPGMDGIETCGILRQNAQLRNTRIVFLTARSEDYSQIAGLDAGADDYISKPIHPKVFISRVKALLRRTDQQEDTAEGRLSIANLVIDREKFLVYRDGAEISLPPKEFELLNLLASRPNKVFTRDEIFENVWGNDVVVGDRTIDVHIRKLREALGIPNVKTVKGVGYKFELR